MDFGRYVRVWVCLPLSRVIEMICMIGSGLRNRFSRLNVVTANVNLVMVAAIKRIGWIDCQVKAAIVPIAQSAPGRGEKEAETPITTP